MRSLHEDMPHCEEVPGLRFAPPGMTHFVDRSSGLVIPDETK
jgi:hypothetical protein